MTRFYFFLMHAFIIIRHIRDGNQLWNLVPGPLKVWNLDKDRRDLAFINPVSETCFRASSYTIIPSLHRAVRSPIEPVCVTS